MAILKRITVRNLDYGAIQRYLVFEHDKATKKPLRDDHGNMILRRGLIQSGLNCDPFTFNTECTELNRQFGKNLKRSDVTAHHYILSFDPRDRQDNGLSPEKAHALATELAQCFFAGHQVLLATHVDGDNHSGNIHTHIILNSLRKETVLWQEFMERPIDAQAGYKHHQTRDLLRSMQATVNQICEREHLHTIDYSLPAERKVTDREYRAALAGQEKLDELNQRIVNDGLIPRNTSFETTKNKLCDAINEAIHNATNEMSFIQFLKEHSSIDVRSKRGCWSFSLPDHKKPIRDRSLGRAYCRNEILQRIAGIETAPKASRPEYTMLPKIFLIHSDLRLVTDLQTCVKAQQSRAYARKVAISNLQQMARSVAYLQEHRIGTLDNLHKLREDAETQYKAASTDVRDTQIRLTAVNTQLHYMGQYLSGKKLYAEFLASDDKPAFRAAHRQVIDEYEAATAYLKGISDKQGFIPIDNLQKEKNALQKDLTHKKIVLRPLAKQRRTLNIIAENVQALIQPQSTFVASLTKQKQDRDTL